MMFKVNLLLCLIFLPGVILSQGLSVAYGGPWGIYQVKYNNVELVDLGKHIGGPVSIEAVTLKKKGGNLTDQWSSVTKHDWDDAKKEFMSVFNDMLLVCNFKQQADTFLIQLTLTNNSPSDTLYGVSICPLTLNFGTRPKNFQAGNPYFANNITGPSIINADFDTYRLVVENADVSKKVYVGLLEENNRNGTVYRVWTGSHPFTGMKDFDSRAELKLPPGKTYTYTVALKFCKTNTNISAVASKTYNSFRKINPLKLNWSDRRPVAALFLSSYTSNKNPANPRNWLYTSAKGTNLTSDAGISELRTWLMQYADRSIGILKDMNAQGMITWDIEGQEYPHALSYIGSPELLEKLSPEMNGLADDYFKKFRNAGLRTGICIRPDSVVVLKNNAGISRIPVKDVAAVLIRKIAYARSRWGCTLFYVDSNVDPQGFVMDAGIFAKVHEKFPDVLLIPEHEGLLYYSSTAPYEELRMGTKGLSEEVMNTYPGAFMVLNVADGFPKATNEENVKIFSDALKQGDILLFRGWFDDQPLNSNIKKAMKMTNK